MLKVQNDEIDNNLNTLFKLVHITTFNVSLQALMLLNQVIQSREDLLNRYFNALYRKMLDLEWRNTSKQTFFLNLLYNSLIKDDALPRIKVGGLIFYWCTDLLTGLIWSYEGIRKTSHANILLAGCTVRVRFVHAHIRVVEREKKSVFIRRFGVDSQRK